MTVNGAALVAALLFLGGGMWPKIALISIVRTYYNMRFYLVL